MSEHYKFFQNRECEYFPCHKTNDPEHFNCLFCFCPLYALGERCGGGLQYTESGIKDCSACLFPHRPENYDRICARFAELAALCRKKKRVRRCKRPRDRLKMESGQYRGAASADSRDAA